jgi:hypothetical protein
MVDFFARFQDKQLFSSLGVPDSNSPVIAAGSNLVPAWRIDHVSDIVSVALKNRTGFARLSIPES